ncbi:acyltransferase [Dyadobacter sp. LJ53]|uniref:acyltransferase family protein n=1 Tax=Dyadobacter chenwenxiniae TaxID=2906456 RepID=UPI001F2C775A|nr:acyltransferase [Dyadobacter chenwenxiniae]MCF0051767.1 acyltransferase [Dyadobacter chenwenxiniae]
MNPSKRIANLDLFRFLAIALVIYYHIGERFTLDKTIAVGKYGVEMFFVLSGFLITNIYYKKSAGENLIRFWLQRFLRTYPPYLAALAISYSAVFFGRRQDFDPGFLFFFQNFYQVIPFFKISWSLCIEEHFYIVFPFVVLLTSRATSSKHARLAVWIAITLTPSVIRYFAGDFQIKEFGYYTTATIFRFDGIALGCTISYIINHYSFSFNSNVYVSLFAAAVFAGISYWLADVDSQFKYCTGYLFLVLSAGMLLISFYFSPDFVLSKTLFVRQIALMAYSLYLTHALILNVFDKIFHKYPAFSILAVPVCVTAMLLVGLAFYKTIEAPSISLRDNLLHFQPSFKRSSRRPS